jgi:hypothetical protein
MQALGEFVDVEQHGAQHVEEALGCVAWSPVQHQQQRLQHGGQGGVFVFDGLQAATGHGVSPVVWRELPTHGVSVP